MKASELVKRLQELIEEYGDHDVWFEEANVAHVEYENDEEFGEFYYMI